MQIWKCKFIYWSTFQYVLVQGAFFNCSSQFSVPTWKTTGSQSEIPFHEILKRSSLVENLFLFSTEIWVEELKKQPCIKWDFFKVDFVAFRMSLSFEKLVSYFLEYFLQCRSWLDWSTWFVMSGARTKVMKWARSWGIDTLFLLVLLVPNSHAKVPFKVVLSTWNFGSMDKIELKKKHLIF